MKTLEDFRMHIVDTSSLPPMVEDERNTRRDRTRTAAAKREAMTRRKARAAKAETLVAA